MSAKPRATGGWTLISPSLSEMIPMRSLRPGGWMVFSRQGMGRHLGSYSQGEREVDRTALQYS